MQFILTKFWRGGEIIGAKNFGLNKMFYLNNDYSFKDWGNGDLNASILQF